LRQRVCIEYQLEFLPDYPEFVHVRACWSYTLCNRNPTASQVYRLAGGPDKPFDQDLSRRTRFTKVTVDGAAISVTKTESPQLLLCSADIEVPAKGARHIVLEGETALGIRQVFPHAMLDATEDLEISVTKPDTIEVVVETLHPRESRLQEVPTASETTRRCWRVVGGILPGHGVCIKWYPVSPPGKKQDEQQLTIPPTMASA
jgi:hypothetical protein